MGQNDFCIKRGQPIPSWDNSHRLSIRGGSRLNVATAVQSSGSTRPSWTSATRAITFSIGCPPVPWLSSSRRPGAI